MSGRFDTTRAIEAEGIVAVIRMTQPDRIRAVIDALVDGGVRALEITMTVPGAIDMIGELTKTRPDGFVLGAGTVLDGETARLVILAGAQFVVSPVLRHDVITTCHRYDVAVIPGCFTPTEILAAWEAGADLVKVFPATVLGPAFVKDVRAPLPQVKLMPTGGVSIDNAGDWIRAGAAAVGVGAALLDPKAIAARQYTCVTDNARRIVQNVRAARETR
jgi:2-dehydro-3-deoxyphosphogluconate aldolase / (4S)-4-hydroxy-2-oxoglutarate aldolase